MTDYGLGELLKLCTGAVGVKTCSGCEKRAAKLDAWGRRSFIGRTVTAAVAAIAAPKLIDAQTNANNYDAVHLLRFINTAQRWHNESEGSYAPDMPALLRSQSVKDLYNDAYAEKHNIGQSLILRMSLHSPEIIPGWTLEFTQSGNKYTAHARTTSTWFSTDENAIITEGHPTMGWFKGMFYKCVGPIGEPGCCCIYACCDQCTCDRTCRYNCGCGCCPWCCTSEC